MLYIIQMSNLSLKNYGYSVWYVIHPYFYFQSDLQMKHIPHVTFMTNLTKEEAYDAAQYAPENITITFENDYLYEFPSFYSSDPLRAVGWWVNTSLVNAKWRPHMSWRYFKQDEEMVYPETMTPKKETYMCTKAVVDTTDDDPAKWKILRDYPF
jgi:hypothetical protein